MKESALNHISETMCVDVVSGVMEGAMRERFLEHVSTCADCEELFRRHAAAFEHFRLSEESTVSGLATHERPSRGRGRPRRRHNVSRLILVGTAAVAAAVVALLMILPLSRHDEQRWITADNRLVQKRATDSGADAAFLAGLDAYRKHDAKRAAELLASSNVADQYDTVRNVYLASALSIDGQYDRALVVMEAMDLTLLPQPWRGEVRHLLERLADKSGSTGQRATTLLGGVE